MLLQLRYYYNHSNVHDNHMMNKKVKETGESKGKNAVALQSWGLGARDYITV